MAQQTAVEWLEEKYHYLLVEADINDMHVVEFDKKRNELFEQAKQMEERQSQLYAAFCLKCVREELKLLQFKDFAKL